MFYFPRKAESLKSTTRREELLSWICRTKIPFSFDLTPKPASTCGIHVPNQVNTRSTSQRNAPLLSELNLQTATRGSVVIDLTHDDYSDTDDEEQQQQKEHQLQQNDKGDNETRGGFKVDAAAERETLVSLMATIDAASKRKSLILDALETFNAQTVDHGNFEGTPHVTDSQEDGLHRAWLLANLELTNHSLNMAMAHLRLMYGEAYTKT